MKVDKKGSCFVEIEHKSSFRKQSATSVAPTKYTPRCTVAVYLFFICLYKGKDSLLEKNVGISQQQAYSSVKEIHTYVMSDCFA